MRKRRPFIRRHATPWTKRDVKTLHRLVVENTPIRVMSLKLGRSETAIRTKAAREGISLRPVNQRPYGGGRPKLRIKCKLPSRFPERTRGLLAQGDLRVNHGRLRAKLVVFNSCRDMDRFWVRYLKNPLGRRCQGAVNPLGHYFLKVDREGESKRVIEADARYFCIIGLVRGYLTTRIVSHESVHAAFCFTKRRARSWWDAQSKHFHEEEIAYPAGEIARAIVAFLLRQKLLDAGSSSEPKTWRPK